MKEKCIAWVNRSYQARTIIFLSKPGVGLVHRSKNMKVSGKMEIL